MPNVGHSNRMAHARSSAPPTGSHFDKLHKNWGSADNIPPVSHNIQMKNQFIVLFAATFFS